VPHKSTGKTEMTKVNVDYPAIALVSNLSSKFGPPIRFQATCWLHDVALCSLLQAFEDPALCFLNNIVRPPKTGIGFGSQTSKSKESYDVERPWSLTPFQPERSPERPKGGVEEGRRERRRRLALPGHGYVEVEQEISLGAKGHYDRDRHGRIKPWKMLRDKKVWDQEEEEKKEEFVRKVAKALKAKAGEGGDEEGGGEAAAGGSGQGGSVSVSVYGPALPGNLRAPVELERWQKSAESLPAGVFSTAGKKQAAAGLEIRQCTGEVPSGTRPDRYRGRFFKEPAVPAAEETPSLAPTAAVADFKRRRQETAAERLARKASKSHKQNLEEYNELMEKIPAHSEQRKINWYKF